MLPRSSLTQRGHPATDRWHLPPGFDETLSSRKEGALGTDLAGPTTCDRWCRSGPAEKKALAIFDTEPLEPLGLDFRLDHLRYRCDA